MSYTVISISRQFGSAGHIIGEKLAKKLGYSYYNQNLISLAAEKSDFTENILNEADEKAANPWFYAAMSQTNQTAFGQTISANDALFVAQSKIIKDIAQKENAVIVGRCSGSILQDESVNLIRIFIYAPMEDRIVRTMERENVDKAKAISLIKRNDKQRKLYNDFYTDIKWGDKSCYDMMINSSAFEFDKIVDYIAGLVE